MQKIIITSHSRYPVARKEIRQNLKKFLAKKGLADDYRVHIMVVGDRQMTELNEKYLKRQGTASVLSFPLYEADQKKPADSFWPKEEKTSLLDLGEIVLSYPQAIKRAMKNNLTLDDEIYFLIEHGLRHLLGEHHD